MINRLEAEDLFKSAAGGSMPSIGDVIQFTERGWRFRPLSLDSDEITWSAIENKPATAVRWPTWNEVSGKPSGGVGYHQHKWADIKDPPAEATRWADWTEVTNKPATFPPSAHASSHHSGGADEIFIQNLRGVLSKSQQHAQTAYLDVPADFVDRLTIGKRFVTTGAYKDSPGADLHNLVIGDVTIIRLDPSVNINLTGITGGQEFRHLVILNVSVNIITVPHESGSSFAANRIRCPGAVAFTVDNNGSADLVYDGTLAKWYIR